MRIPVYTEEASIGGGPLGGGNSYSGNGRGGKSDIGKICTLFSPQVAFLPPFNVVLALMRADKA